MSLRVALSMWAAQNHQHGKVRHEDVDEFGAREQSVSLCTSCTGPVHPARLLCSSFKSMFDQSFLLSAVIGTQMSVPAAWLVV